MNDLQTIDLVESEEEFTLFETQEETRLTTNIYEEIRRRLEQRGIPPSAIAFIHDTKNTEQRNALFAAVNRGDVRILIGSTERMGTGMNVQERCLAIHHLVPPWRPSDIEQQLGRGLRQGNLYRQIFQFVYITKGSFDGYSWQLLETKAGFIAQIESGKITAREMEDVGDTVMTMSEIKALASGNPLIMQKVVADSELTRLSAIYQGWKSSQNKQHWNIRSLESERLGCLAAIESFTEAIRLRNTSYTSDEDRKHFRIQLRKLHLEAFVEYTDREAAGKHLRDLATLAAISIKRHIVKENVHIGTFRGLPLYASVYQLKADLTPEPVVYIPVGKSNLMIHIGESDVGITQSLDTRVRNLDSDLDELRKKQATLEHRIASIKDELERPWELQARYDQVRAAVDELDRQLDLSQQAVQETGELLTAKSQSLELDDTTLELTHALDAIRAMHCNPALLARFDVDSQPVTILRESLHAMEASIQSEEALLSFGRAVLGVNSAQQISWDDWLHQQVPDTKTAPRRAKNAKESKGQLSMF